jgi:hypothetical protein
MIAGSLAQWRAWTGLPFDTDGEVEVPGALQGAKLIRRFVVKHSDHAKEVER